MADIKSKKFTGVYYRILEDKSKTFFIVYKDPIDGKTKRLKIGNSKDGFNEAYANNKRAEIIAKTRLGEDLNIPILAKKQNKEKLNDLATKYFTSKSGLDKVKSLNERQSKYNKHIKDNLGLKSLATITKADGAELQKRLLKEGYSNATVNNIIYLVSTVFNFGIKEGHYKSFNPFTGINKLNEDNERQRFLNKDEVSILLETVKKDEVLHLFTVLSLTTGARVESILHIQKKDINFSQNSITISDLKSGGFYAGALTDRAKELILKNYESLKSDDFIVSYEAGAKCEVKRIQRRLSPILNELFNKELQKDDRKNRVVIHTLRHTLASLLATNNTPILTISKVLNHKDIKQTMRYAKLSPDNPTSEVMKLFN